MDERVYINVMNMINGNQAMTLEDENELRERIRYLNKLEEERMNIMEECKTKELFDTKIIEDPVIEDSREEKIKKIKEVRDGIINQIKNFDVLDNIETSVKDRVTDSISQVMNHAISKCNTVKVFIARPFNDIFYYSNEGLKKIYMENDRVINKIKEESNYKSYYIQAIYNAYKLDKYSSILDMEKTSLIKDISLVCAADIVYFPKGWKEYKECKCYEAIAREYSSTIIYETEE